MSEQDRLRAKLAHEYADRHAPTLAEQLYQVDKGHRMAKLDDLLTPSSRQAYLTAAHDALIGLYLGAQRQRMQSVQAAIAEHHARKEDEHESARRQASRDVAHYGGRRTH